MTIRTIIVRILRQFKRDKRSLALMLVAPLFILTLMWLVFDSDNYVPKIAVVDVPDPIVNVLEEQDAEIYEYDQEQAEKALKEGEIDAWISMNQGEPEIMLEGSDPTANKASMTVIQEAFQKMNSSQNQTKPDISVLHGYEDIGLFDNIGPVLIGFFVFFFVFIIGGISFLRERTQGTLERILSTPLKRWELVTGYVLGFGIFTIIQSILIVWFSIEVLGMWMEGNFIDVVIVIVLLAFTALTLATLLSAFANNEFQMMQFIPLVIVPQVFFSGLFKLETMEPWLQAIGKVMPLTYGAEAIRGIMLRGEGLSGIQMDLYVLLGFSFVFYFLNILALKKHRKL